MTKTSDTPKSLPDPQNRTWRQLLIDAKKQGASDVVAAHYAGLSEDELEEKLEADPTLGRDMCHARAAALLSHLDSMSSASQWQAHEYLLEHLWPAEFGDRPPPEVETRQFQEIRHSMRSMTVSETKHIGQIIELGIAARRELERAAQTEVSPYVCQNGIKPSSPT